MDIITAPPKSTQVAEHITETIKAGKLAPGDRMVPARDLAAQFKVSKQVIQSAYKILTDKGLIETFVGKGTFVKNNNSLKASPTIILASDGTTDSHAALPKALLSSFQDNGFLTNIFDFQIKNSRNSISSFEKILSITPRALVIDAFSVFPFQILSQLQNDTQLIFVNRFEGKQKYNASYILTDYEYGGYLAAKSTFKYKPDRVTILSFTRGSGWTSDLFALGCEKACLEAGIDNYNYLNFSQTNDNDILQYFNKPPKKQKDALLIFPEFYISRIHKLLKKARISIPEDIVIVGYGNTPWAEAYDLTTIQPPVNELVKSVNEALNQEQNIEVMAKPTLIFRSSCPE